MTTHPIRRRRRSPFRMRRYHPIRLDNSVYLSRNLESVFDEIVSILTAKYHKVVSSYLEQQDRRRAVVDTSYTENPVDLELWISSNWYSKTGQIAITILDIFSDRIPQEIRFLTDFLSNSISITTNRAIKLRNEVSSLGDPMEDWQVSITGESLLGYDYESLPISVRIVDPLKKPKPRRKTFRRGYNDKGSLASVSSKARKDATRNFADLERDYNSIKGLFMITESDKMSFDDTVQFLSTQTGLSPNRILTVMGYHSDGFF